MDRKEDKLLAENLEMIMDHFGINNQLRKFNEECFELMEAIIRSEYPAIAKDNKPKYLKKLEKDHIAEEIADCMVLLNQFIRKYNIDTLTIHKLFKEKIGRTIKRIEEGYYV